MKKKLIAILTLLLAINAHSSTAPAPKPTTVKTYGTYTGKDSDGKPICLTSNNVCIFKTYIVQEGSVFPLGIVSATWKDPDTGNQIPISSVTQTFIPGGYKLNFTYGISWTGPFSINSSDWSIVSP